MQIGAIFDWDGVVIDSSEAHERAWERLAELEGRHLPSDHFTRGFGRTNQVIIPDILGWTSDPAEIARMADRKEAIYREIFFGGNAEPLPGVREFLAGLKEAGIPCSVGSSTPLDNLRAGLDAMDLNPYFQAIVSGDDVKKGKPDPEGFLKAAGLLGVPPAQCVVFEDAHHGIEAAIAGGMKVVAVATTHPVAELTYANAVCHRLDELNAEKLLALFA